MPMVQPEKTDTCDSLKDRCMGVIDCGSNAIRFTIYRLNDLSEPVQVFAKRFPVRLGAGTFANGQIAAADINAAVEAFREIKSVAGEHDAVALPAVATSAVRDASNATEFVDLVALETGIILSPITGEEEAELIAAGVNSTVTVNANRVIFDIGGGSTEIIRCRPDGEILEKVSLPLGAVRLAQEAGMPDLYDNDDLLTIRETIGHVLQQQFGGGTDHGDFGIAIGGTASALAQFASIRNFMEDKHRLTLQAVVDSYHALVQMTPEEMVADAAIDQSRAMIIVPGVLIFMGVMAFQGLEEVLVSNAGVREGLVSRFLAGTLHRPTSD